MRHFTNLPPNYGSRRFKRCPPSHHKMALSPHLAQASAQAPRPSRPTPPSTVTSAQVSPHHRRGSTMPSAAAPAAHSSLHFAPFVSMGGERPHTRPYDRSNGSLAPSPDLFGASTPSRSHRHDTFFENMGGGRTRARSNDRSYGSMAPSPATTGAATPLPSSDSPSLPARSPPSPSTTSGGGYYLTAKTAKPSVRVTPSSHPTAIVEWAACATADDVFVSAREILAYWDANASPQERTLCDEDTCGPPRSSCLPHRERILANERSEVRRAQWICTYLAMSVSPSHPHHQMGGRSPGLMAPSPATTGAAMPSPSLARRSPSARSTPSHPTRTMGGSSKGSMAPSSASSRTAPPSPSSASPSSPARFSPSPSIILGEGASLAEHRAATVLQCWKRRIWLRRWFDQQALLKQKRLCLQALCRGASTYASSVRGNRRPPPTPTKKSSDPKVLNQPFRSRGQPLPPRKMRRRHKRPRRRPGRRHRPRAPNTDSGGGPSCMPMVFWAAQTIAASTLLGVGATTLTIYISPTSAASKIQQAYRFYRIRCNRLLLPGLQGPYKARIGSIFANADWASKRNTYYWS